MTELAFLTPAIALLSGFVVCLARTPAQADRLNLVAAILTGATGLALAASAIDGPALETGWLLVDGASGVFVAVIAIVGLCSALVSPSYLRTSGRSWFTAASNTIE